MCGIVGVISADFGDVLHDLANGAHFLQHRGPAYAGLFAWNSTTRSGRLVKGEGLADDIFAAEKDIHGDLGVAHTRYKTFGSGGKRNAQPFVDYFSSLALAHNGHITNTRQIEESLAARGQQLEADCDAEPLLRVLALWFEHFQTEESAAGESENMFRAIREVQQRVKGAYSVVVASPSALYAFCDPHGFRPMVLGRRDEEGQRAWMVASESLALEQNGFEIVEEASPGMAYHINREMECERRELLALEARPCAFELIYFADVESRMMGDSIRSHRWRAGRALAYYLADTAPEVLEAIDVVIPIPHSPIPGAEAFAQKIQEILPESRSQYATPVSKYRYGGRIFMAETQKARDEAAMLDFRVDSKTLAGKTVFVIDDSIVRGTNAIRIVRALRAAGAGRIYFGVLWPMVIDSCFQGINTPTQSELIGARFNGDLDEVRRELGVDGLFYLPIDRFREQVLKGRPACMACATGQRAVKFECAGEVLPEIARAARIR